MSDIINFKGVSGGVYIEIREDNIDEIRANIGEVVKKSGQFFKGTKFLGFKGEKLSVKDTLDLSYMLKYKYNFDISIEDILGNLEELTTILEEKDNKDREIKEDIGEISQGPTRFIYGTLRSGQEVEYEGNIVVVGDVNPGAFLKADGNIIVLGSLKGVAYAGQKGNTKSIVAAYNLLPTQLRIAEIMGRAPDEDVDEYKAPEVAKILDDKVVIEPYLPNK